MSITRRFLKGIGITDEQADAIIEAHTSVTERMQAEIDGLKPFKADAEKLSTVQKELDEATKKIADYEDVVKKYKDEVKAFEDFKKDIENQNSLNKVKDAYKALLTANNVDSKRIDTILKVTDFSNKSLNDKGKFENEKDLVDAIKTEWGDFIVTTEQRGAPVETPPANTGSKMTKADIMKIKDTEARQKAIAENPELFGISAE